MTALAQTFCGLLGGHIRELFTCTPAGEYTRIRTPFLYPDGDAVDLFAKQNAGSLGGIVTDMGETVRWLRGQTLAPKRTPKQTALIQDICLTVGVEFYRGSIVARYASEQQFSEVAASVAQAAMRVSDLSLSFRNRAVESVTGEVEDFLIGEGIKYERSPSLAGRSGRVWHPDFHTFTEEKSALVYVLSTGSRSAARSVAEHVLSAWYDLSTFRVGMNRLEFVSLFDDTADVWAQEDFQLISDLSVVARWSQPERVAEVLKRRAP
jgi:hypothetical protein